ncbi:MAG: hypothetical protein ACPG61_10245 [Paracoccaceae bacterium]
MSDLPRFAKFWMVCRKPAGPGARTQPSVRYSHLADAEDAARRLANETDAPHLILETVAVVHPGSDDQKGLF